MTNQLNAPGACAISGDFMYVTENSAIRKISKTGQATTVFGNNSPEFTNIDGPAATATMNAYGNGLTVASNGDVYFSCYDNVSNMNCQKIRKYSNGVVSTVFGSTQTYWTDTSGYPQVVYYLNELTGEKVYAYTSPSNPDTSNAPSWWDKNYRPAWRDGNGLEVCLETPEGLHFDSQGNLYVADTHTIRKIDPQGNSSTIIGKPYFYESFTTKAVGYTNTKTPLCSKPSDFTVTELSGTYTAGYAEYYSPGSFLEIRYVLTYIDTNGIETAGTTFTQNYTVLNPTTSPALHIKQINLPTPPSNADKVVIYGSSTRLGLPSDIFPYILAILPANTSTYTDDPSLSNEIYKSNKIDNYDIFNYSWGNFAFQYIQELYIEGDYIYFSDTQKNLVYKLNLLTGVCNVVVIGSSSVRHGFLGKTAQASLAETPGKPTLTATAGSPTEIANSTKYAFIISAIDSNGIETIGSEPTDPLYVSYSDSAIFTIIPPPTIPNAAKLKLFMSEASGPFYHLKKQDTNGFYDVGSIIYDPSDYSILRDSNNMGPLFTPSGLGRISQPVGIIRDPNNSNNLLIAGSNDCCIYIFNETSKELTSTIAPIDSGYAADSMDGYDQNVGFGFPFYLTKGWNNEIYVDDWYGETIRKIEYGTWTFDGVVQTAPENITIPAQFQSALLDGDILDPDERNFQSKSYLFDLDGSKNYRIDLTSLTNTELDFDIYNSTGEMVTGSHWDYDIGQSYLDIIAGDFTSGNYKLTVYPYYTTFTPPYMFILSIKVV